MGTPWVLLLVLAAVAAPAFEVAWEGATLQVDDHGRVTGLIDRATGENHASPGGALARLELDGRTLSPTRAAYDGQRVRLGFDGGIELVLKVTCGAGFSWWEVESLTGVEPAKLSRLVLADLRLSGLPRLGAGAGLAFSDTYGVAVMPTHLNVHLLGAGPGNPGQTSPQVTMRFERETGEVKAGTAAARFDATSTRPGNDGWAYRAHPLDPTLDLSGLRAIKAWIYGDGAGESLKFQLTDGKGGYQDNYAPITFTGWREVTIAKPDLDTIDKGHVTGLGLYYNNLPGNRSVSTRIDAIRAVVATATGEREVVLADFEDPASDWWASAAASLRVQTEQGHGILPAGCGIVGAPRARYTAAIAAFERAAGLPSPRLGGTWARESSWVKRSYLFITSFGEPDTDEVIRWARRGGMPMVLIGDGSWNVTGGHHEVNKTRFPEGLPSLQRTASRMHGAGLRVGLHFLAPAVYLNDPYVTPKPDPRLFKDKTFTLAAPVDAKTDFLPTVEPPKGVPVVEKDAYREAGMWLQVGDELVHYQGVKLEAPYGFTGVARGQLGTTAAAHAANDRVAHLKRSYGYFLFDVDSTLANEVTGNVARVANAIGADMLYMDGSEGTQGDHWYDNAKIQDLYYRQLKNPNTLMQGSSYSAWSWHFIPRYASADGHGDVKGYLDERIPSFKWYFDNLMPLDCGWYYVYDPEVTLDQYDYILQRCLGFDSSISIQTNPQNMRTHPEIGPIFDLANLYERLRLSGKVPEEVKAKLREPKREYRTLQHPLRLRRTVFAPWNETGFDAPLKLAATPEQPGARLGLQVRCGRLTRPGPSYTSPKAVMLETFDDLAPYVSDPQNHFSVFVIGPDAKGDAGSTLPGVTQQLESVPEGPTGGRCAKYTATSTRSDAAGWSSLGRRFDPALDLSASQGLGFWLKGNGQGGAFKLQLRDEQNANDWYLTNDFTTWRYIQLKRPEGPSPHVVDYHHVRYLAIYYNGLPAKSTATMWIDDIKALPAIDQATLVRPTLTVGERTLTFATTLVEGERLVYFPGEAPYVIPAQQGERRTLPEVEALTLAEPTAAMVSAGEGSSASAKVRLVQDLPEEIKLDETALTTVLKPLP